MIKGYDALGQTVPERQALFNSCPVAFVAKDYTDSGRVVWAIFTGTDSNFFGVVCRQSQHATRGEALHKALAEYPRLEIWAQWGDEFALVQDMAADIHVAIQRQLKG